MSVCASLLLYASARSILEIRTTYVGSLPMKQLFASIPAASTLDIRDDARAPTYARTVVLRTHRAAPTEPVRGSGARAAPVVACVALLAVVFCRIRSPAAIVTMLAEAGQEVSVELPEDVCDIGPPMAKAVCLSSVDGAAMGKWDIQWVLNGVKAVGPRVKAARPKVPKMN